MRVLRILLLGLLLVGCQPEPQPIRYGEDACTQCRMTVSDERFGAELLTTTGKTYPFDSVECLAEYVLAHADAPTHSLWVTSYDAPGDLILLDDAFFVHAPGLRSPMGRGLAAFGPETGQADALVRFDGAEVLTWDEVLALAGRPIQAGATVPGTHVRSSSSY